MNAFDQEGDGTCQFHHFKHDDDDDSVIRTGFAYGLLNCLLTSVGIVLAALVLFGCSCSRQEASKKMWTALRTTMYISLWCCLCTFYIQDAEICHTVKCSLGPAGIVQVVNALILMIISVLMHLFGDYAHATRAPERESSQTEANGELLTPSILVLPQTRSDGQEGVLISACLETKTLLPDGSIECKVERLHSDGSKTINITTIDDINNSTRVVHVDNDTNDTMAASLPLDGVVIDTNDSTPQRADLSQSV
mmetsp:Transcript_34166/g.82823  ORF Transcript_34166/g.82823 Transcript_34166/m.82823 type:complete len:251 (-) Transcript_34166:369-1121(-)